MVKSSGSPRSPKRRQRSRNKANWYTYRAGFATAFVRDALAMIGISRPAMVADPWNGAGTTTEIAHECGFSTSGFDLNPVMVTVAKARFLGSKLVPTHTLLSKHILKKARRYSAGVLEPDPLSTWFTPRAASTLRSIERALQHLLVDDGKYKAAAEWTSYELISPVAAFYYVALFKTVRHLLAPFRSSNPTWIKLPESKANRLRPSQDTVEDLFHSYVRDMAEALPKHDEHADQDPEGCKADVMLADSRSLPLGSCTVDAIISSPPYCTRIDYAIATRAELAVLGFGPEMLRELRERMIGTSTVAANTPEPRPEWGLACNNFLESVRKHSSRASASYYWKNHLQYFESMYLSLHEIRRVLKSGAACVLVVQDSRYKDLHNDLPTYFEDMTESVGLQLVKRFDYSVQNTFAALHKHRKKYRNDATATESVLWLAK